MAHTGTPGHNFSGSTGTTIAVTYTPVAGNILIAFGYCNNAATTFAISDTAGNSWTIANPKTTTTATAGITWWAQANGSSSTTITVTTTSNNFRGLIVDEFSGRNVSTPIDNHAEAVNPTTGAPTVNITPNVTSCDLYGATVDSVTGAGSGFFLGGDDTQQDITEFKNNIATGSQTVNYTGGSAAWLAFALTIAPASGASFQPDEDFWDGPLGPRSMISAASLSQQNLLPVINALLLNDQDLAGPLFGQPDEDYWSIFVVQPLIPVISVFS